MAAAARPTARRGRPERARPARETGESPRAYRLGNTIVLENGLLRVEFPLQNGFIERANWHVRAGRGYSLAGATFPLAAVTLNTGEGRVFEMPAAQFRPSELRLAQSKTTAAIRAQRTLDPGDGGPDAARCTLALDFLLSAGDNACRVKCSLTTDSAVGLIRLAGPVLLAGQGSFGAKKDFALFPGLEFLRGDERSSSERDADPPVSLRLVPHPLRITVPVMAISKGPLLAALAWNPLQKWDGENSYPSAIFASPNWKQGENNHLMGLFVPSVPEWVKENETEAATPYPLEAGRSVTLEAAVILDHDPQSRFPDSLILEAIDHWYRLYGLPKPPPMARSYPEELALSRHGFLVSCWDEKTQKSRHCVDWAPANAPGFATLLWLDARLEKDAGLRAPLDERADLIARNTLSEQGPAGLISGANCHIMRWEFPFYRGYVAQALGAMEQAARAAMRAQQPDGSWLFTPTGKQRSLGKWGDTVVGTCAPHAHTILRYARITGDQEAKTAGLRALKFMEQFRIPAGAQAWECPLYEPDILASARALAAYLEGYRLTSDPHLLAAARYWARTGLPFLYAYNRPDTPGMRYASIPVFGTTFYTHSWLGVPVQWNGLVYAYYLQQLAEFDKSFPWRTVAQGITNSATHQQVAEEGKLKGSYCDGWYQFCTDKRGAWINPENIFVNLFTLRGFDPDVSTAILPAKPPIHRPHVILSDLSRVALAKREAKNPILQSIHISSGARVKSARLTKGRLEIVLSCFPGQVSNTLVSGLPVPEAVSADGRALTRRERLEPETLNPGAPWPPEEGWAYNPGYDNKSEKQHLIIKAPHTKSDLHLTIAL